MARFAAEQGALVEDAFRARSQRGLEQGESPYLGHLRHFNSECGWQGGVGKWDSGCQPGAVTVSKPSGFGEKSRALN